MIKKFVILVILVLIILQTGIFLSKENQEVKKIGVIEISDAEHLDSNRNYLSNIYEKVKSLDEEWIKIKNKNFLRITFEKNLTNKNDITIYARGNNSVIKVYKKNTFKEIAKFENVSQKNWYKVYLNKLNNKESYKIFDLELFGDVEFDYITDPTTISLNPMDDGNVSRTASCTAYVRDKTGNKSMVGRNSASPGSPVISYFYFNLSTIPAGATINSVTLNISVDLVSSPTSCHIWNLEVGNSSTDADDLWTDAGNGTNYIYNSDFCQTTGFKQIDLGNNATTNMSLAQGWFGIGMPTNLSCGLGTPPLSQFDTSENLSYAPTLIVTYTPAGGDTTPPTFTSISNITHYTNQSVLGNFEATDETDFDSYTLNDTTKFSINITGDLINSTSLSVGIIYLNVSINDSSNNTFGVVINVTTLRQVHIFPNITIIFPTNNTNTTDTNLDVNYTRTDDFGIDSCWYSNNSGLNNYTLASCNNITSATWLEGLNNLTFWINDSDNNVNSTKVSFRIDTLKPYFNPLPVNQSVYTNQSLLYDINAFDDGVGFSNYSVNNTIQFSINLTGGLVNISTLSIANYSINISINDSVGNLNSSIIVISVTEGTTADTTKPFFTHLLTNQSYEYHIGLNYDINATDNNELDSYSVNDTRFTINLTGSLKNSSQLAVRSYYINISINDTSNNLNSSMLNVSVTQTNSIIYLSIAGTRANYSTNNNTNINFSAELILGFTENITILINDSISANKSLMTSNTTKITEVGNDYNVTAIYYGNTNFSKATETWWLDVSEYSAPSENQGGTGGFWRRIIPKKINKTEEKIEIKKECESNKDCKKSYSCFEERCVKLFDIEILEIESVIKDLSFNLMYYLKGMAQINGDVLVEFWIENSDEEIQLGKDYIYLGSFEERIKQTKLNLPREIKNDDYKLYVKISFENYQVESFRMINIERNGEDYEIKERKIDKYAEKFLEIVGSSTSEMTQTIIKTNLIKNYFLFELIKNILKNLTQSFENLFFNPSV